jgi:hypothetical protein
MRVAEINFHELFHLKLFISLIHFRNHVTIVHSNSNYAQCDITDSLCSIFSLKTPPPVSDHHILHAANHMLSSINEVIIEFEPLFGHLDTIIMWSCCQHFRIVEEAQWAKEPGTAAIVWFENEEAGEQEVGVEDFRLEFARDTSPACHYWLVLGLAPNKSFGWEQNSSITIMSGLSRSKHHLL